jgi:hypothetical protein
MVGDVSWGDIDWVRYLFALSLTLVESAGRLCFIDFGYSADNDISDTTG